MVFSSILKDFRNFLKSYLYRTVTTWKHKECRSHQYHNHSGWLSLLFGSIEALVCLGVKTILIHNINTSDSLTNGQLGILVGLIKSDLQHTDKLVVKFNNKNAGKETRNRYPGITAKYQDGTIIERVSYKYPISKKSKEARYMK